LLNASSPTRQLAPLLKDREGARRARHQETVAAGDQALDIAGIRVGMAARDVVLLTNFENAINQ
jgi:hypothetical protein